jgi:hypothetical protein
MSNHAAQRQNEALMHKTRGLDMYGVSRSNKVALTPHCCEQDFDAVWPLTGRHAGSLLTCWLGVNQVGLAP